MSDIQNYLENLSLKHFKKWLEYEKIEIPEKYKNLEYFFENLERKNEIIKYFSEIYNYRISEINKYYSKFEDFIPKYCDYSLEWETHLKEFGWTVIFLKNWDEKYFVDAFFSWLESCCENFKRNDPKTWKNENLPTNNKGIFGYYLGHTEFQWRIREMCAPYFAELLDCTSEDLLTSFDGGGFLTQHMNKYNNFFYKWLHIDQYKEISNITCVQGLVNFVDNGPKDGGLVLVEKSHKIYKEYINSDFDDENYAHMQHPLLKNLQLIKVCAPSGSLILWDGTMFHCNIPPYLDDKVRFRMCTYVCMVPKSFSYEKEMKTRYELYQKGLMTAHWPFGPSIDERAKYSHHFENPPKDKDTGNKPKVIEIAKLNHLRKKLIGYFPE